jgi:hypothetical protein
MAGSYGQCYFYTGFSGKQGRGVQFGKSQNENKNEQPENKKKRVVKELNQISFFGIKLSYSKAFGIAFLIIFLLLFFPGIGVSSSAVNSKTQTAGGEKGYSKIKQQK